MKPRAAGQGIACALALAVVGLMAAADAAEWTPLFNGKNLDGWTSRSKDKFKVEDGMLVGSQDDGRGDDLVTTKQFDNFELRAVYKIKWPANSGIWFRYKGGKGYQFDILKYKRPIAYSGTLYCPGKMFITKNLDEAIENRDGWNRAQIYANGDHLILWLNGQKVGECHDNTLSKGAIGIQVHGGGALKGMRIEFKKIEIRELKPGDKPTPPPAASKGKL